MSNKNLITAAPYFVVSNLHESVAYYENSLGFKAAELWGEPPTFAMPQRDGITIMLNEADETSAPSPNRTRSGFWDAYIWVNDVEALFSEMKANGAIIDYEPEVMQAYGMREFAVRDPDGYLIAFAQGVEDDTPEV